MGRNKIIAIAILTHGLMLTTSNATVVNDSILEQRILKVEKQINAIKSDVASNKVSIRKIETNINTSSCKIDSLSSNLTQTNQDIVNTKNDIQSSVRDTDSKLQESISRTNKSVSSKAKILGVAIVASFLIACLLIWLLRKYVLKKDNTLEGISKAQNTLQQTQQELLEAQKKLAEESLSLDSKLIEFMEKQLNMPQQEKTLEVDHTLALKIADEITRMEVNLYRMDSSIRGYKQLIKAIDRIRETYASKGYEITKLIGEKYFEGMKVVADFVDDETIPQGSQVITSVKKPQVIYNGLLLQSAVLTVNQNI